MRAALRHREPIAGTPGCERLGCCKKHGLPEPASSCPCTCSTALPHITLLRATLPCVRSPSAGPPSHVSRSPSPGHAAARHPQRTTLLHVTLAPSMRYLAASVPPSLCHTALLCHHIPLTHPGQTPQQQKPHEQPPARGHRSPQPCCAPQGRGAGHRDTLSPATSQAVAVTPATGTAPVPLGSPGKHNVCQAEAGRSLGRRRATFSPVYSETGA